MWKPISHAFANFGPRKESVKPNQVYQEFTDDETCSNASSEEGLECPICWESFNIVENVPYVLWCGHTLCKNCVLGLRWATVKFSTQQIQIPFFISCPWCNLLTSRLVYKGNLKFPSKNFFLLWMVEGRNGDRVNSSSVICGDNQRTHHRGRLGCERNDHNHISSSIHIERSHFSLHKSLDFFIRLTTKFPLIIALLLFVLCVLPTSATILLMYLVITVLFAFPSFLVLYFMYPVLNWLVREITT